jgi:Na+/H+ antiporter NhaD/arsenite permease-like protein
VEKVRSFVPSILLLALIGGLSVSALFDRDFRWFAGVYAMILGSLGLLWYRLRAHWGRTRKLVGMLDWDTTLFLVGVFVLVGAVSKSGWLESLAHGLTAVVGSNTAWAYILIVGLAVLVSAFVDNVPFLLAMIPVTQTVANNLGTNVPLLMFGLLVGACLGGNITPIGASANIVVVGMLNKRGHAVSFREFMAIGCPFTLAAVVAASFLLWMIWS